MPGTILSDKAATLSSTKWNAVQVMFIALCRWCTTVLMRTGEQWPSSCNRKLNISCYMWYGPVGFETGSLPPHSQWLIPLILNLSINHQYLIHAYLWRKSNDYTCYIPRQSPPQTVILAHSYVQPISCLCDILDHCNLFLFFF